MERLVRLHREMQKPDAPLKPVEGPQDDRLRSLSRQENIINYRKGARAHHDSQLTSPRKFETNVKSAPAPSKVKSFNPIVLSEMKSLEVTYTGRRLTGTLVGKICQAKAIFSLIEDEERNVQRICFYDVTQPQKVCLGAKIEVDNPHFKRARDLKTMIRVDNPKSFRIISQQDICSYCSRTIPDFKRCSNCGALYCCAECQQRDWKELQHKLICFK